MISILVILRAGSPPAAKAELLTLVLACRLGQNLSNKVVESADRCSRVSLNCVLRRGVDVSQVTLRASSSLQRSRHSLHRAERLFTEGEGVHFGPPLCLSIKQVIARSLPLNLFLASGPPERYQTSEKPSTWLSCRWMNSVGSCSS